MNRRTFFRGVVGAAVAAPVVAKAAAASPEIFPTITFEESVVEAVVLEYVDDYAPKWQVNAADCIEGSISVEAVRGDGSYLRAALPAYAGLLYLPPGSDILQHLALYDRFIFDGGDILPRYQCLAHPIKYKVTPHLLEFEARVVSTRFDDRYLRDAEALADQFERERWYTGSKESRLITP